MTKYIFSPFFSPDILNFEEILRKLKKVLDFIFVMGYNLIVYEVTPQN